MTDVLKFLHSYLEDPTVIMSKERVNEIIAEIESKDEKIMDLVEEITDLELDLRDAYKEIKNLERTIIMGERG